MSANEPAGTTADGAGRPTPGGTWCCELEVSGTPEVRSVVPARDRTRARVLARLHGEPLGYLVVPLTGGVLDTTAVAAEARERFGDLVAGHLAAEGVAQPLAAELLPEASAGCPNRVESDATVSVVVCTRDRAATLSACLERLQGLTHPRLEVLVVDNAPTDPATREVVTALAAADPRFRYVLEPRPGLSRARNRGLAEATGTYVAYTDDDVAVDPGWVQGLLRGFRRRPDVTCVTGLACTADLDGPEEEYFDARAASWSTRCLPELYDLRAAALPDALYPYSAGVFGTGANFAFLRSSLVALGGFDEALGAGTLTRGGEDLDVFVRVLRSGAAIAYEPAAVVWHSHRADRPGLLRQMYGYGTGLTAFLTKYVLDHETRGDVLRRVPRGLVRMARIRAQTRTRRAAVAGGDAQDTVPRAPAAYDGAFSREALGYLAGPVLYLRARRELRRS
jgi:glycosyltransferase involved in cell wall biosynthesis